MVWIKTVVLLRETFHSTIFTIIMKQLTRWKPRVMNTNANITDINSELLISIIISNKATFNIHGLMHRHEDQVSLTRNRGRRRIMFLKSSYVLNLKPTCTTQCICISIKVQRIFLSLWFEWHFSWSLIWQMESINIFNKDVLLILKWLSKNYDVQTEGQRISLSIKVAKLSLILKKYIFSFPKWSVEKF